VTSAPPKLLEARNLLLEHLNFDKTKVRGADLEPAEVGIVGDPNHRGGYHCGSNRVVKNDYSVVESRRDKRGLSIYASALDVGEFEKGKHNLRTFSLWCVDQCKAKARDARDIREIIYSPDGRTVKRWDALGIRSGGDASHLFHTHFSIFRDADGSTLLALFRRYLTETGFIKAPPKPLPPVEDDDVKLTDVVPGTDRENRTVQDILADAANLRNFLMSNPNGYRGPSAPASTTLLAQLAQLPDAVRGLQSDIAAIRLLLESQES
jgi:hypothetical protein